MAGFPWALVILCLIFVKGHEVSDASNPRETTIHIFLNLHLLKNEESKYEHEIRGEDIPLWQKDPPACTRCVATVNFLQYFIALNKTTEDIGQISNELCQIFNIQPPKICQGYARLLVPVLVTVLKNTTNTPREVCSFIESEMCGNGDVPKHRWTVELPQVPKPPRTPRKPSAPKAPKLRVLHITDTHYDPEYQIGAKDMCELKMCCRRDNGMATKNDSAAGKWGGWKCDIPERTLDNYLNHINNTHGKFDYIVWTGDLPPHNYWSRTMEESIFMLNRTVAKIRRMFPDTPIFPVFGNHEVTPSNQYPSPAIGNQYRISWLYEEAYKNWKAFLPETTRSSILHGGYYVVPVYPKLKLISLNTNFCHGANWWLILNSTDPANMLKWFAEELQKAENENVKVHVIAHIPPGSTSCLKIWSQNFYKIIDRYEATVTAQFYGHTHLDTLEIYYDIETGKRPTGVGLIGPSATTYKFKNPSYRIYTIDGNYEGSQYFVDNFETWVMNLTEANLNDNPDWYKLFNAKENYKLSSLLPEGWHDFYLRLKKDQNLMTTYYRNFWTDSPKRLPYDEKRDRKKLLCGIRSCVHYGPPS